MAFRFRKLRVYTEAIEFHRLVVRITKKFPSEFSYLTSQLRRASLSVALNIAEGSAKSSDKDFRRYIGNALGSINEAVAGLEVAVVEKIVLERDFREAEQAAENLTNQLGSFSKRLNSTS